MSAQYPIPDKTACRVAFLTTRADEVVGGRSRCGAQHPDLAALRALPRCALEALVTEADIREPHTVLTAPGVAGLLDFSRPVPVSARWTRSTSHAGRAR